MYFKEQQIGTSDKAIMEMCISRCIIAKILEQYGVLKKDYTFYNEDWLGYGMNYEKIYTIKARIETLNEAMQLLEIGSVSYREIDEGLEITLITPGIIITDYDDLFDNDELAYDWQAELFLDENKDKLKSADGVYVVKFNDFMMLPHDMLQKLLNYKGV